MPSEVTATFVNDDAEAYEQRHVHAVYDHIASHFSSTRYKVVTNPLVLLRQATER
jgi:tRNA (uracil-5-)-methyltransferase TRM9